MWQKDHEEEKAKERARRWNDYAFNSYYMERRECVRKQKQKGRTKE